MKDNGVFYGGSFDVDSSASILGRKKQKDEVIQKEQVYQSKFNEVLRELEELKEKALSNKLKEDETRQQLQKLELSLQADVKDIAQLSENNNLLITKIEKLEIDKKNLEQECDASSIKIVDIENKNQQWSGHKQELDQNILRLNQEIKEEQVRLDSEERVSKEIKILEASLRERADGAEKQLGYRQSYIQEKKTRLGELERFLDRVSQEKNQFSVDDKSIQEKIEKTSKELFSKKEEFSKLRNEIEVLQNSVLESREKVKKAQSRSTLKKNYSDLLATIKIILLKNL